MLSNFQVGSLPKFGKGDFLEGMWGASYPIMLGASWKSNNELHQDESIYNFEKSTFFHGDAIILPLNTVNKVSFLNQKSSHKEL